MQSLLIMKPWWGSLKRHNKAIEADTSVTVNPIKIPKPSAAQVKVLQMMVEEDAEVRQNLLGQVEEV